MFGKIHTSLYFLLSFCVIGGIGLCTHGSYLNLCGYCVGGTTGKSDLEGLDRCGVCHGQGDCVGCDGIINSPRKRDTCGLCLAPDAEQWNDCRKIESVYPSVLDLSVDSALLPLTVMGAGLAQSDMNTTQCHILPLESQTDSPVVKEISLEENEIQVKVLLGKSTGKYRVGCSEIEDFAELRIVDSRRLNTISVKPSEVTVDTTVKLEVEIEEDNSGNTNGTYWCFVRMSVDETRTFRAIRSSSRSLKCAEFTVTKPGIFRVGVVAHEGAAVGENSTGRTAELRSRAKPPIAEAATYSPDLQNIGIKFDQNINIRDCNGTFSPDTEISFGKGFKCTVVADTLYVTPGDEPQIAESVTIIGSNSIRRDGSLEEEISPNARAVTLPVSKQDVMTPRFTLSLPNALCADKIKQPVINVMVSRLGKQRLEYIWAVPPSKEWKGRSQRENMLLWRHARSVEAELNNKSQIGAFLFNRTNLRPGFNYILNLKTSTVLGDHRGLTANLKIPEEGNVSITVTAFPSASAIVAEVRVVFCADKDRRSLRYRWKVDGNVVSEDGKLLIIPQTTPGTYNISCTVYNHETNQILGTDSTVTEVVKLPQRTVIFPANTVVGTMDDITLQAYPGEEKIRWSCSTSHGEPCITVGPKAYPVEDIVDVTSPTVRIPAGALPIGSYVWTLNGMDYATAGVTISPNIPPILKVAPPPAEVDSTKPLSLNADVERLKPGCRITWKTTRRKGYHYFDLQGDVGLGDLMEIQVDDPMMEEREAPLVIPPARGKWKGLLGGAMYLLTLQTVCPKPTPEVCTDVAVIVNGPPSEIDVEITPETGEAVNTKFNIRVSEGSDSVRDYPLVYRISYRDESDEVQMGFSVLTDFVVSLPPGNLTVIVRSCDIRDSCSKSSKVIMVQEAPNISSEVIRDLSEEIRNDMLSGDTVSAYGKAITAFKTLSVKPEYREKLNEISSAMETAIRDRLDDLTNRVRTDSKLIKQSFEFLEQSVTSLKFFPGTKELVNTLTEFKNLITKRFTVGRWKRETLKVMREGMRSTYEDGLYRALDRPTRNAIDGNVNENTIKAIFDLHAKILEQNNTDSNREEFLKDVRKYMIETCSFIQESIQGPIVIESSIVTLEVMKLTQNDIKKDLQITSAPNATLRLNMKSISRKTCAAIAKYQDDFMGMTNTSRVSDVFEVRIIKNGTFKDGFKDEAKSIVITLPLHNTDSHHEVVDCMSWSNDNGWKPMCNLKMKAGNVITCSCKDPGIFSAFVARQATQDTAVSMVNSTIPLINTTVGTTTIGTTAMQAVTNTTSTTTVPTTISTTTMTTTTTTAATTTTTITSVTTAKTTIAIAVATTNNITVKNVSEPGNALVTTVPPLITKAPTSSTTTVKTTTSTDKTIITSVIQDISNLRSNMTTLYISGTFKIEEDYRKTVGKNETAFKENLKKQLAQQLSISENVIANLIIKPGSILVTVLFVDTNETKAETAIKELVTKLHEGTLQLTSQNATVLHVPQQDLKVKIGTPLSRNTNKVRLITYGIVVGTLIIIFLFAVGATYFKRKRTRMPLRLPRLSIDDHPTYRQFHNEFSLDGSSATLARYRRDHPFETETMQ